MRAYVFFSLALMVVFETAAMSALREVERPSLVSAPAAVNPALISDLPTLADGAGYGRLRASR